MRDARRQFTRGTTRLTHTAVYPVSPFVDHTQGYVYIALGFAIMAKHKQMARSLHWEAEQFARQPIVVRVMTEGMPLLGRA